MKLSIIIINEDAYEYIPNLMDSLIEQLNGRSIETVFIDNSRKQIALNSYSNYITKSYSFSHQVEHRGMLYNKAAELADGDYVLFIHSDIYFCEGFFDSLFRIFESGQSFDFANVDQLYVEGWNFGQNQLFIDYNNSDVFITQPWQTVFEHTFINECSESCFIVNRDIFKKYLFNIQYLKSFYEYDFIKEIYFSGGTIINLNECTIVHYFIETHEKMKCLLSDKSMWINKNLGIYRALEEKETTLMQKDQILQKKDATLIHREQALQVKEETILQKKQIIQEKEAALIQKDQILQEKIEMLIQKIQVIQEKEELLIQKDQVIQEKEEALIQKDQVIQVKEEALIQKAHVIQEKEEALIQKDQVIQEKDATIKNIYRSGGWKLLLRYYRFRDKLLPDNTMRKLFAKLLIKFMRNPGPFIKDINIKNMKILISYLNKENIDKVDSRIEKYLLKYQEPPQTELELFENQQIKDKLIFPKFDNMLVSIVIPVYNQWDYTYSCLQSILENTQEVNYEVIIADDVSSDDTTNIQSYIENITVVRNKSNLGFLRNCNNAAKNVRGKYVLFLNNDTNVQKDWLISLVALIEKDSMIGMVGSKLVYPDGKLQEAGGIIWRDASGWNYGRLDDPEKPEYNYLKEVDYISGAAIMIRTDLWTKIGGFDERYVPAYFEDADLAFEVRKLGYKVVFQPKSVVVHFEGVSHGTDTGSGVKSYQIKNRESFIDKWKDVLEREHFENGQNVFLARDRSESKKTILVIDHYVPHYDQDAGSRTTYQYLKLFIDMGFNVKFMGDNFYRHEPYTTVLEQMGIEVLYGIWYRDNYKKWIKNNAENIDYVYLNRPHISVKYIDFIKANTRAKIFYYGHDLHFLREARQAEIENNSELLKSAEKMKTQELELIAKADMVYYPSNVEIEEIKKYLPRTRAKAILPYMYENNEWSVNNDFQQRKDLLFVGGFSHVPNLDGIDWFLDEIYPHIVKAVPTIKIFIVGSNPPESLKKRQSENVVVTGYVSDAELEAYYHKCRLVVVPLRYGAGVKGKVVEAMYYQLPIITTSIGAEGLIDIEKTVLIEDRVNAFYQKIIEIYYDISELTQLSKKSVEYINKFYSKEAARNIILEDFCEI